MNAMTASVGARVRATYIALWTMEFQCHMTGRQPPWVLENQRSQLAHLSLDIDARELADLGGLPEHAKAAILDCAAQIRTAKVKAFERSNMLSTEANRLIDLVRPIRKVLHGPYLHLRQVDDPLYDSDPELAAQRLREKWFTGSMTGGGVPWPDSGNAWASQGDGSSTPPPPSPPPEPAPQSSD